ncbi:MAG: hypothetical protein HOC74_02155 [Gemmatimonadetes bacterium]|nr:hypothetical protein [Gemmatimonadota bacterium]
MTRRPKIAALVSTYHRYAHAQHIVDRFLEGYGWNGRHHRLEMDLVSLYVDQVKENDVSRERESRFDDLTIYPTIADALTLGGSQLAVDGVLLIAEHGEYQNNEKGQTLWPRYEFFRQMVSVFRASGRGVPVFNDKHLSWKWEWAKEMCDTARELDFPFMAGSSLPVTWRTPSIDMPLGVGVEEGMCVGCGWIDGGDFHAYETIQGMVERRKGGECGVGWIQAFRGEAFWEAHAEGCWSPELFEACLCRSHNLSPARAGFNHTHPTLDEMREKVKDPWAYQYEHLDGLKCTMIALNGMVGDFNFAARIEGQEAPLLTQMYLPMPPAQTTLANFFSPLVNNVEQMFLSGKPSYPVERTLLTTGLTAAGVESLYQDQKRLETPHLDVAYAPNPESTYWRS